MCSTYISYSNTIPPGFQFMLADTLVHTDTCFLLRYQPKVPCPALPWVPAAGIMINCFLIGTLSLYTFYFWGAWMLLAFTIYLTYGEESDMATCVITKPAPV